MPALLSRPKKTSKRGVQLTLMIVGASGTGRTTFINTLVGKKGWLSHADPIKEGATELPEVQVTTKSVELKEDNVHISLTVCDTPGFGDNLDNESAFGIINQYLDDQYESMLDQEMRVKRNPQFIDDRVHVILYFITPTGHGLREIDIEFMKRIAPQANVIPVIGKADCLTVSELKDFKKRVMEDIEHYGIPVFNFPFEEEYDDEEVIAENTELREMLPFAIGASEEDVEFDGEIVPGRKFPWGTFVVDEHSDFATLRSVLFGTHLKELRDITKEVMYEKYRTKALSKRVSEPDKDQEGSEEVSMQFLQSKEEEINKEKENVMEVGMRVQREIEQRKLEIQAKEEMLRELERSQNSGS